jgi:4-alpha-glucanotransferase
MKANELDRRCGILLHPTCFPGTQGIGTLGGEAVAFLDFACRAGARVWQVCPLGPTGYGDSPYQCFSAFAGNPLLIDLEELVSTRLLSRADLAPLAALPRDRVDFGALIPLKWALLRKAFDRFASRPTDGASWRFGAFVRSEDSWLADYALFMALKDRFGGLPWNLWPEDIRRREESALQKYRAELAAEVRFHQFVQWLFFSQWARVRTAAAERSILILGDRPIYAAYDSADVWSAPGLFRLDADLAPIEVAGVPPDYFSPTGQLWGNPLYDWEAMEADGFRWWIAVIRSQLRTVDCLRIDHFRGFAAYWAVPFGEKTAVRGRWRTAPGERLFDAVFAALGRLPIVAENLGVITEDVTALMDRCGFPGMKVLQFAFDSSEENDHLPHAIDPRSVVYTGTHDNDTTAGWFAKARPADRELARRYLDFRGQDRAVPRAFIRAAFASVAAWAIVPLQDVLGLGSEARMNTPGTAGGNWTWRYRPADLRGSVADGLRETAALYGR